MIAQVSTVIKGVGSGHESGVRYEEFLLVC